MDISIGTTRAAKIALGSTEILKVSIGDTLVWPSGPIYPQITRLEYIGSTTSVSNDALAMPSGVQDGDLVIFSCFYVNNFSISSGLPSAAYPLQILSPSINTSGVVSRGLFNVGVKSSAMVNPIPATAMQYQADKVCTVYRAYDTNNNVIPIPNFSHRQWSSQLTAGDPTLVSCLLSAEDFGKATALFVATYGCRQTIPDSQAIFTGAAPSRSLVVSDSTERVKILENPTAGLTMTVDMPQVGAANYYSAVSLEILSGGPVDLGTETITVISPPASSFASGTVSFYFNGLTALAVNANGGTSSTTSPAKAWSQVGNGIATSNTYVSYQYLAKTVTGTGVAGFNLNSNQLPESGPSGENRVVLGVDASLVATAECNYGPGTADISVRVSFWADATATEPLAFGIYNMDITNP